MVQHVPILVQRPLQAVQVFLDLCQHGGVVAHQVLGDPGPRYLPANGEVRVKGPGGRPSQPISLRAPVLDPKAVASMPIWWSSRR
jgi:hypothetical protein